ncbi:hypothetical protein [Nocardia pseudobrasiliensis]|nr:hypothetical protein [Nocardia pseudobrasiliensis]
MNNPGEPPRADDNPSGDAPASAHDEHRTPMEGAELIAELKAAEQQAETARAEEAELIAELRAAEQQADTARAEEVELIAELRAASNRPLFHFDLTRFLLVIIGVIVLGVLVMLYVVLEFHGM